MGNGFSVFCIVNKVFIFLIKFDICTEKCFYLFFNCNNYLISTEMNQENTLS